MELWSLLLLLLRLWAPGTFQMGFVFLEMGNHLPCPSARWMSSEGSVELGRTQDLASGF